MIQLTQDEINAVNLLGAQVQNAQVQLNQTQAARTAVINLLEAKYDAVFDPEKKQFIEKKKEK